MSVAEQQILQRTDGVPTFGLLVPHFGEHATRERVLGAGPLAEDSGFDGVWVRDHLLWEPHEFEESSDRTFVEPMAVLNAIAATTTRIAVGTGVLIPLRWPLKLAHELASLDYLSGGRVVAGLGRGSNHAELATVGLDSRKSATIVRESAEIVRSVLSNDHVSYEGEVFSFNDVSIGPRPKHEIPLWYGGTGPKSVEVAARGFDGWITGRLPLRALRERITKLAQLSERSGRIIPTATMTLVRVADSTAEAQRGLDLQALLHSTESTESGAADARVSEDDLAGIIAAGTATEVTEQLSALVRLGIDHIVFDFRLDFERFEEMVGVVAKEVLPQLRKVSKEVA